MEFMCTRWLCLCPSTAAASSRTHPNIMEEPSGSQLRGISSCSSGAVWSHIFPLHPSIDPRMFSLNKAPSGLERPTLLLLLKQVSKTAVTESISWELNRKLEGYKNIMLLISIFKLWMAFHRKPKTVGEKIKIFLQRWQTLKPWNELFCIFRASYLFSLNEPEDLNTNSSLHLQ